MPKAISNGHRIAVRLRPTLTRSDDGSATVGGYAAVYYREDDPGTEFQLWDDLYERILPGAFDRAVEEGDDVRCLFNHDASAILGRTKSKTLRLSLDAKGLRYECDVPDTQAGRDLMTSLERGDIDASSFGFEPTDQVMREETRDGVRRYIREIAGCKLFDVAPVAFPAYESTTAEARAAIRADIGRKLKQETEAMKALTRKLTSYAARARQVRAEDEPAPADDAAAAMEAMLESWAVAADGMSEQAQKYEGLEPIVEAADALAAACRDAIAATDDEPADDAGAEGAPDDVVDE